MTKSARKMKSFGIVAVAALMTGSLVASQVLPVYGKVRSAVATPSQSETPVISEYKGKLDTGLASQYDTSVVQKLPDGLSPEKEVSIIVKTADDALIDAYDAQKGVSRYATVADFSASTQGLEISRKIDRLNGRAKTLLENTGVKFSYGVNYDVLMGGFEIVTKAGNYQTLAKALQGTGFKADICEVYERAEAQLVENEVKVHDTGIFDSTDSAYDGSGVVIAVLDTGLDYTHTAFDPARFSSEHIAMTQETISGKISDLRAAQYTSGLSAADVYLNAKVPYAYDYADHDPDVYPLQSEHGTHVSGIIVGNDDEIRGVAPNAQLVSMKVFSDTTTGAKSSWLLSALEDCVVLEVDIINMSLGSSSGFTTESKEEQRVVYDKLKEHGISLIAAASNDYNSTFGSTKNGNLGLTTNPDSATVGSPSTYAAALSVASISGVKTPYLTYNNQIIYFTEASDASSEPKDFVDDILPEGENEKTYDYVTIAGVGRSSDYRNVDVNGKIALVRRGDTSFEDKARVAQNAGAAGLIVYNNVSGDISMTVGAATLAVCSISQDNGEMLAANKTGQITISRSQVAGPFMSNFSSWGPSPDLRIKPEITAHGGEIYSAVPGQDYDRLSGTSMAAPNQAGLTALVRQYVQGLYPNATRTERVALVNQFMMSTADIAYNINGLPYSVRKQGAGLANLQKATSVSAYISTFARNDEAVANGETDRFTDEIIDKAKIEYGDDKQKSGVYEMKFNVNNVSQSSLTYDVGAIVMTEGISKTKTHKGDTTVTEEGYLLEGAKFSVVSVEGGTNSGNNVTVDANKTATVVVRIELSDSDKQYLDQNSGRKDANGNDIKVFANGMYVEGFITLKPVGGSADALNVPYLAFYGDWTQAPLFDLDYFETDADDRDDSIETLDKTLPDAYATRPIGGLSDDYINYLGSYYFIQSKAGTQISADRNHISLSNQEDAVNYIYGIYAGMLRGAKRVIMTITDTSTGEVIWTKTEENQRKSYSQGANIYASLIDVDFHVDDFDLKNNTQYLFRAEAKLDYPGEQNNLRDVFEFPFTTDFQSPVLTDAEFYTEYDSEAKKNRLYARLHIYDNHYTMAYQSGRVYRDEEGKPTLDNFTRLLTPVYSDYNSTTESVLEITDYVQSMSGSYRPNTFTVAIYDYAMNESVFEITIPDSVRYLYFNEMQTEGGEPLAEGQYGVTLSPNQTYVLEPVLYPATQWKETLVYTSSDENVLRVVNDRIIALAPGVATVTAKSSIDDTVTSTLTVKVLAENEEGWVYYDKPVVESFRLKGYTTDQAFYIISSSDRDIGITGQRMLFSANATSYSLSMYPSEKVTVLYELSAYFPEETKIIYEADGKFVKVDENGQITALKEGISSVNVRVMTVAEDGSLKSTLYDKTISITVKNPYERSGPYLTSYRGGGINEGKDDGIVSIPESLGFTQISQYAFSGYQTVPKDLEAGDEISEEDPGTTKIWYYGDNKDVKWVIIPEGVEVIGLYAFAGMTGLEHVTLPSTLTKIEAGAFYECPNLTTIDGLENVKFINQSAFSGPEIENDKGEVIGYDAAKLTDLRKDAFSSIVAIGDKAFRGSELPTIELPASAQSIGAYTFAESLLSDVRINAQKIKLGAYAFAGCENLTTIEINASVIPDSAFGGCPNLSTVTLGADVENIGLDSFYGTNVSKFNVKSGNKFFKAQNGGEYLVSADGKTLVYVAPKCSNKLTIEGVEKVGVNAFAGHTAVTSIVMPDVTSVGNYAFFGCEALLTLELGELTSIGDYAFAGTSIRTLPMASRTFSENLGEIGAFAFALTNLTSVTIPSGMKIGEGAFRSCEALASVTIGDDVEIGAYAFGGLPSYAHRTQDVGVGDQLGSNQATVIEYYISNSVLTSLTIGNNANIGAYAFSFAMSLESVTIGEGATFGEGAFYNDEALTQIDLSKAKVIGDGAFSGSPVSVFVVTLQNGSISAVDGMIGYYGAQAPAIASADLTSATKLGINAFANATELTSVVLNSEITEIPDQAFYSTKLSQIDLSNITKIGTGAFYGTMLKNVNVTKVTDIGALAFGSTPIVSIELCDNVLIGDRAFYGCENLTEINLGAALKIGAGAFMGTAISGDIDLSKAVSIGDNAFANTAITGVTFSENLLTGELPGGEEPVLGENPFAGCRQLGAFTKEEDVLFNGVVVDTVTTENFKVNEKVQVKDGALYSTVANGGLQLVCYPYAIENRTATVAEGTVRISSYAFLGNRSLKSVVLPSTLNSIGDRAFYGCASLEFVTFKSLRAPILEEQYDTAWANYESYSNWIGVDEDGDGVADYFYCSLPGPGIMGSLSDGTEIHCLGIYQYNTWNLNDANFFYGATFKDRVGLMAPNLVMVRPANGTNYDSFVYGLYFGSVVDGAVAADRTTLNAIAAIEALPEFVTLDNKAQVAEARALYNMIATIEQQALVTNYSKLTSAESTIEFLENQNKPEPPVIVDPKPTSNNGLVITLGVLCGVFGAAAIAAFVLLFLEKRGNKAQAEETEEDVEGSEESSDTNEKTDE